MLKGELNANRAYKHDIILLSNPKAVCDAFGAGIERKSMAIYENSWPICVEGRCDNQGCCGDVGDSLV